MISFDENILWESWAPFMSEMSHSDYFKNLLGTLMNEYETTTVRPERADVFKAFIKCPYDKVKVVILGQDPYPNKMATGLCFANPNELGGKISPSLKKIKECIEDTVYNGLDLAFDPSLEHLPPQGVLLLNTTLTVRDRQIGSHMKMWNKFTIFTLSELNKHPNKIIYCLWGKKAQMYSKYIDLNRHYVLNYHHPSYSARQGKKWECPHFVEINKILENERDSSSIRW